MGIDCSRRGFLGGVCAAFGGLILPADAFGSGTPDLKLGVISDVHVGADSGGHAIDMDRRLERALRWFDAQGVDAVMVPGDIAHSGLIRELERFAKIWDSVFPGGRGADGRSVEKLFVTGTPTWTPGGSRTRPSGGRRTSSTARTTAGKSGKGCSTRSGN